jgi:hypothetical protein
VTNVEVVDFTDRDIAVREAVGNDFDASNTSDILWYHRASGDVGQYVMNNGQPPKDAV